MMTFYGDERRTNGGALSMFPCTSALFCSTRTKLCSFSFFKGPLSRVLHIFVHVHTCIQECMHTCIHTYVHTTEYNSHNADIRTYILHTYIPDDWSLRLVYIHTHTYIHAYIHTYIHTYVRTYIHAHTNTYINT
jgi:hypothetical protein